MDRQDTNVDRRSGLDRGADSRARMGEWRAAILGVVLLCLLCLVLP